MVAAIIFIITVTIILLLLGMQTVGSQATKFGVSPSTRGTLKILLKEKQLGDWICSILLDALPDFLQALGAVFSPVLSALAVHT